MPKKDKGYIWMRGEELPFLEPHSLQKHRVYSAYVRSYINILAQNPRVSKLPIIYVDGFAGGGLYQDSVTRELQLGSPLLLLDAVREAEVSINIKRKSQSIRTPFQVLPEFHFIDSAEPHIEFLKEELVKRGHGNSIGVSIFLHHSRFTKVNQKIIERIKVRARSGRSIFFLDQYGYTDVPFASINSILTQLPRAEVILTFATDHLIAYLSEKNRNQYAKILEKINLDEFIDIDELLAKGEAAPEFRLFVQSQLIVPLQQASGALFFTPFYITSNSSNRAYWLIHFSMHPKARDAMLTEHWAHQNTFDHYGRAGLDMLGYATRDDLEAGMETALAFKFEDTAKKRAHAALLFDIPRRLTQYADWIEVRTFLVEIANETPANVDLLLTVLTELSQSKEIESRGIDGVLRRSGTNIKQSDMIRLTRQIMIDLGR